MSRACRHGHAKKGATTRVYKIWDHMRQRCQNKSRNNYARYGGRGINVCDRWNKFDNFLADMGEPNAEQSIDRINNDGNYEPSNCRWATRIEQMRNTSTSLLITIGSETLTRGEWGRRFGITGHSISHRLSKGWTTEQAVKAPKNPGSPMLPRKRREYRI